MNSLSSKPAVRVFISSPSDVRPELLFAERVIKRLSREFAYHFDVSRCFGNVSR